LFKLEQNTNKALNPSKVYDIRGNIANILKREINLNTSVHFRALSDSTKLSMAVQTDKKHLIIVVGPTAVGKTALCVRLAKIFNTEIISADSRQFYKEMSIGTAKPTSEEQEGIKHHFVDTHSITTDFNAGMYEDEVLELLNRLYKKHDVVILTGGSGMYIRAITDGLDEMPEADLLMREKLQHQFEEQGLSPLLEQLNQLDPIYFNKVDKANPQRIIRALEVCLTSGQPYSSFRKNDKQERPFHIIKIGLTREREELYKRIDQRMESMLEQGLLEEAKALYPYRSHNALQTVGYKEIFEYLDGIYDWKETVRLLKRNSRRYAKRQLTWFHKYPDYNWFEPDQLEDILAYIKEKLQD
jgi:tRNA dimethylallyltransferase